MKPLYTFQEARRWKQRSTSALAASAGVVTLALAVCIVLCTQVSTANAQALLFWVVTLFTLAGWTAILLLCFMYAPAKAQAEHIRGILAEEAQIHEGTLTMHRDSFRIPGSITVRKATLLTEDGPLSLNVSAGLANKLPDGAVHLRVWTVRRFITAYEVIA